MARLLLALPRFHTNLWFATRAMLAAGHELRYLVNGSAPGEEHGHLVPRVLGRSPSQAEVAAEIADFRPDLVIVRNAWGLSRRLSTAARRAGVPRLLYNQLPLTRRTGLMRRLELLARDLPRQRITPVPGLPGGASPDPLATYLPWPVAALPGDEPALRRPDRVNILCVGKLWLGRKNHHQLVQAIEQAGLADRVHLRFIGSARDGSGNDGAAQTVLALAQREWVSVETDVAFLRMPAFYRAADICVLPSIGEPLGTAPVEAMAYGVVPVISDDTGSAGYLTPGRDGHLVDMRDPGALAGVLKRLVESPDDRARLSAAATRLAETELGEARFIERLDSLLARHVGARRGSDPVTRPQAG